jgi:hypothetical protein
LELAFDSEFLRTICECEAYARLQLGPTVAEVLKHRLADLRASKSVADLVAGSPRFLNSTIDHKYMSIDVSDGYVIVFCANHTKQPVSTDGKFEWINVSRIKILKIERKNVN